jgi:hypothetical protein
MQAQDHQLSQSEVDALIKKVRMDPRANNHPVLGVNMLALQAAQNGGYPKHMYHDTLDAVVVMGNAEEAAVSSAGFTPYYKRREYPRWLHRRNTDDKFRADGYIESVIVQTEAAEKYLRSQKAPSTAGPWCLTSTAIEPLPDAPAEDPAITQARLEAQIDELRKQVAAKAAKG